MPFASLEDPPDDRARHVHASDCPFFLKRFDGKGLELFELQKRTRQKRLKSVVGKAVDGVGEVELPG